MLWPKVGIRPGVVLAAGADGAAAFEASAGAPETSPDTVPPPGLKQHHHPTALAGEQRQGGLCEPLGQRQG